MDSSCFPWQPLGGLLVERGLLTELRLERALAEQRRTGRLLGVILVESGYVSGGALARMLAEQHGVELRGEAPAPASPSTPGGSFSASPTDRAWRPLGALLVQRGFLDQAELDRALAVQQARPERRLGELLVELECLSGAELARALALQQGVEVSESELDGGLEAVIVPPAPGHDLYCVAEVVFDPDYRTGPVLYRSSNLLEASEFALEYVGAHDPHALEIQREGGAKRESVWTYSAARARALAASRRNAATA